MFLPASFGLPFCPESPEEFILRLFRLIPETILSVLAMFSMTVAMPINRMPLTTYDRNSVRKVVNEKCLDEL